MRTRFLRRHLLAAGLLATAGCAAPAWPYLGVGSVHEPEYALLARADPLASEPGVTVTTLAGSAGRNGRLDKAGPEARFSHPRGIAYDPAARRLLVADTANHAIRSVGLDGTVETYAGTGKRGNYYEVLSATARHRATFAMPYAVAVTGGGTAYVTDTGRHQLQRLTAAGVNSLTGLWAVVNRRSTPLYAHPAAVAVDSRGTIYFLQGHGLFRITNGALSTVAGVYSASGTLFETYVNAYESARPRPSLVDGPGAIARFALPQGLVVDAEDNLYVADTFHHVIRKVTFVGGGVTVTTVAGERSTGLPYVTGLKGYKDGPANAARFTFPCGLALDGRGNLIVADRGNHAVRKVASGTRAVTSLVGATGLAGFADGPGDTAGFKQPTGVAVGPDGAIYVTDSGNHTIRRIAL